VFPWDKRPKVVQGIVEELRGILRWPLRGGGVTILGFFITTYFFKRILPYAMHSMHVMFIQSCYSASWASGRPLQLSDDGIWSALNCSLLITHLFVRHHFLQLDTSSSITTNHRYCSIAARKGQIWAHPDYKSRSPSSWRPLGPALLRPFPRTRFDLGTNRVFALKTQQ
jgi:hypothetical protein